MNSTKVSFRNSIGGSIIFYCLFPSALVLVAVIVYFASRNYSDRKQSLEATIYRLSERVAQQIEIEYIKGVEITKTMAIAQENGLFGERKASIEFARNVLLRSPDFSGAYFAYEPNADGQDDAYVDTDDDIFKLAIDEETGRFIPYLYKDHFGEESIYMEPLLDMETRDYYQGVKELYKNTGEIKAMLTEPFRYNELTIIEQTYPIIIDNQFVGIAGLDKAISQLDEFLNEIKKRDFADIFILGREERFLSMTTPEYDELITTDLADSSYENLFRGFYESHGNNLFKLHDPYLNEDCYYLNSFVPGADWMIVVRIPYESLIAPIRKELITSLLISLLGMLVVFLFALRYIRILSRKLESAAEASVKVASGDYSKRFDIETEKWDELALFFFSLNEMVVQIRDREAEINEMNRSLERKVDEIIEEYRLEKERAEAATKVKSDFLARISHEIRIPMNAVIGLSFLVLKTNTDVTQRNYVLNIHRYAKGLLGTINDILEFSKIENGEIQINSDSFDLDAVLDDLSDVVSFRALQKNLELVFSVDKEVPFSLIGNPLRLRQILINLINNAIKFTEEGEVVLDISLEKKSENKVVLNFKVIDNGFGMPASMMESLLKDSVTQDNGEYRQYTGAGMGLTICKNLSNLMGGKLLVKSEEGQGSEFLSQLPFEFNFDTTKTHHLDFSELAVPSALICDDSRTSRSALSSILRSFSIDIHAVSSGFECIEVLERGLVPPNTMLFIDESMPLLNGEETIKRLNSGVLSGKSNPVVMMSLDKETYPGIEKSEHIDAILKKPFGLRSTYNAIARALGKKEFQIYSWIEPVKFTEEKLKGIKGANVLLFEDNKMNQMIVKAIIESVGCNVELAENGAVGLELISKNRDGYDLVFMDLQMPVMNGYKASVEIRKNDALDVLPIVAMAADAVKGVRTRCLKFGMNDYITKPIDPDEVIEILLKYIEPKERSGSDVASAPQI